VESSTIFNSPKTLVFIGLLAAFGMDAAVNDAVAAPMSVGIRLDQFRNGVSCRAYGTLGMPMRDAAATQVRGTNLVPLEAGGTYLLQVYRTAEPQGAGLSGIASVKANMPYTLQSEFAR
jgi:hypothetical protein